jgi:UDP-N-acetyl-D-glucosamine dehydrogenase
LNTGQKKVVIVGQGYVGLPVAMRAVEVGYNVVGIDLDVNRVGNLRRGVSYVDDVPDRQLQHAISSGRYLATDDYDDTADFDIAVITVPTPLRDSLPDLSYIEESAKSLAKRLKKGTTVVLESTTYPGTTEELLVPILETGSGLVASVDFYVGYSPERIDPGNKTWGFKETPKVVSGLDEVSLSFVQSFYDDLVDQTVPVSTPKEAELTKLLENTFRHVNIALVNELAIFANQLGVNVWEAIEAASTKPFGFMKFTPGPGVGGHCLPVDPSYLSWQVRRQLGRTTSCSAPSRFSTTRARQPGARQSFLSGSPTRKTRATTAKHLRGASSNYCTDMGQPSSPPTHTWRRTVGRTRQNGSI